MEATSTERMNHRYILWYLLLAGAYGLGVILPGRWIPEYPSVLGSVVFAAIALFSMRAHIQALSAHAIEALYLDAAGTGEKYYAHDAAGNLIRDDRGYRYSYDYENRLSKVEKPDGAGDWRTVATFEYDALGRRIRKTSYDSVPSVATLYYYDPDWRCLEEYEGGTLDRLYVYGNYIDEVVLSGGSAGAYYTLHDHLHSPVALLDTGTGAVLERYEYDAYGTVHVLTSDFQALTGSQYGNPYSFTGRRLDVLDEGSLNLMYYRERAYSSHVGRFIQHDPLGYIDSLSLYQYVRSNPLGFRDPYGTGLWKDFKEWLCEVFKVGGDPGNAAGAGKCIVKGIEAGNEEAKRRAYMNELCKDVFCDDEIDPRTYYECKNGKWRIKPIYRPILNPILGPPADPNLPQVGDPNDPVIRKQSRALFHTYDTVTYTIMAIASTVPGGLPHVY